MNAAVDLNRSVPPNPGCTAQLVEVRPELVETIGHVLGNLFQRIYHLIEQVGRGETAGAAQLATSTRQLEEFLQLVIDYFSPLSLALEFVSGAEVAQSLAGHLSSRVEAGVRADVPSESRLLVDPARLTRAFALLAGQLTQRTDDDSAQLRCTVRPAGGTLTFTLAVPAGLLAAASSAAEMQWAVAEKLVVMHGGTLHRMTAPSGEMSWEITLPLQS